MYRLLFALCFVVSLFFPKSVFGCSGILIRSQGGSIVTGRTVEFATPLKMSVAVVPRNYKFSGTTPMGPGLAYESKYAYAGIYCFSNQIIMDGMNEEGLVAAAFFFPGYAEYTATTAQNKNKSLSPVDFTNWILSQFSSIEELSSALSSVCIAPTVLQGWGDAPPPFHYIVYDKTGRSLVIEPINGQLITNENPIGSFTNSPAFDWHLTNLSNYINLSPCNPAPLTIRGETLQAYGQGAGMNGLPGSFSSTSRFIRCSLFSANAVEVSDASELPMQAFHILNQFDIPKGIVRAENNGSINYDMTQVTNVKDPNTLKYYFRSYNDQAVRYVDLNELNYNAESIKVLSIQGTQASLDVSGALN